MKIGDHVQCGVYVCNEFRATSRGIIVSLHSGYAEVDIGSLHGCAPWILQQTFADLRMKEPTP